MITVWHNASFPNAIKRRVSLGGCNYWKKGEAKRIVRPLIIRGRLRKKGKKGKKKGKKERRRKKKRGREFHSRGKGGGEYWWRLIFRHDPREMMSGQRGIRTDGEQERWIKSENSNGSRRRREIIISGVEIHECKGYKKYETLNEMEQKKKARKKILSFNLYHHSEKNSRIWILLKNQRLEGRKE